MYPLRVGVTMSMHKLTAGAGYDYLTRQVAALDSTEKGHAGLASYYTERGETPGVWIGSGLDGIDGLTAGDSVTAEQMRALFGCGLHPLAELRQRQLEGPDLTERDYQDAARLGAPFKIVDSDVSPFRLEVAKRIGAIQTAGGLPADAPLPAADRARVRTEVARQFFLAAHGREPVDARELAGQIAKDSRPRTQTVAGFDLTFSPVKSVSTLWAVAEPAVAAVIEQAHQAAVNDALAFIEKHALFTRTGPQGIRQVNVRGLVAAAFTHRDSRAGDPDLHTHVAVANKVQTLDGRWLSIDGRVMFKANVAASETYNTALEQHLRDNLGVRFAERPGTDPAKRPIREIVGVDPRLNQRWSTRRTHINTRRGDLAVQFQHDHGRPPTPVEALHLAQQATLETRDAKHEPRSLTEQRATWLSEAAAVLGSSEAVASMVQTALAPPAETTPIADTRWIAQTASHITAVMEESRSTWQMWHVRAEAQRHVRTIDAPAEQAAALVDLLVDEVLDRRSVALAAPDNILEPEVLRRVDGSSVYTVAGADLYTSQRILDAERRLLTAAGRRDGSAVDQVAVELALLEMAANGTALDAGQAFLVRRMCSSGARLQLAIAPAGAGKTTAMRALTLAWTQDGGQVLGLATSAAAAAVLAEQTGIRTDTLAKLTWSLQAGDLPQWAGAVGRSTLLIIDEAGMADTVSLDTAVQFAIKRGASVRLVGDDQQLAAIGAGGVLRDITHTHGALRLTELHRFTDPAEAAASLALREGQPEALDFYLDHGRVHVGDLATTTQDAFNAWVSDRAAGLDTIMIAPTRHLVAELNVRARAHRLDHSPAAAEVTLADGNRASIGDVIITRSNDRRLRLTATDWVKNGDRWTITQVGKQGDLTVRHTRSHHTVRLPADYVRTSTGLGYATTIHAAQGVTADTMHGLATGQESRQQLYTMLTRGRVANHVYLQVVGDGDPHSIIRPDTVAPRTPTETLRQILARDDTPTSATTLLRELSDPAARLYAAVQRYTDSLQVAAEHLVGLQIVQLLDDRADQVIPELTSEPSWPTLRAHLLALAAETGEHPLLHLQAAATGRELHTANDMAAVLDWRLPEPAPTDPGPLPWLPGIPSTLHDHHVWGEYLAKRSQLVVGLANQVRDCASQKSEQPVWAPPGSHPSVALIAEIAVWRAAVGVDPQDRRPTGAGQLQAASALWQQNLDRDVALCSHRVGADVGKRQVGGPSQDHQREDRHRMPPARDVRRSVPPGPRV
jgi:conjugative relaxase-like TrwC/TraI family protein